LGIGQYKMMFVLLNSHGIIVSTGDNAGIALH